MPMPLVGLSELLRPAREAGYGIAAFNVFNVESVRAVIDAAEAEEAPVILMTGANDLAATGEAYLGELAVRAAERARVPVCVHLDHSKSFDLVMRCIRMGYTSVMIDGSHLPFDENVALTRRVVEAAHAAGVDVEAELGQVLRGKHTMVDRQSQLTDPDAAAEFVRQTGVDALAVAIGTAHGLYDIPPQLDFARLERIAALCDVPLVMHGGTGTPDDAIQRAIALGMVKVNVGTQLRKDFIEAFVSASGSSGVDVRKPLAAAREAMQRTAADRMRVFGAAGRAVRPRG